MLKYKPFIDAEGRVKGWYEEQENTNEAKREATGKLKRSSAKEGKKPKGTLGGLILEDCTTKVEVRVGGGFTADQRRDCGNSSNKIPALLKSSSPTRNRRWARRISLAIRTLWSSFTSVQSGISQNNPVAPGVSPSHNHRIETQRRHRWVWC
jgi:hypothetical protein